MVIGAHGFENKNPHQFLAISAAGTSGWRGRTFAEQTTPGGIAMMGRRFSQGAGLRGPAECLPQNPAGLSLLPRPLR